MIEQVQLDDIQWLRLHADDMEGLGNSNCAANCRIIADRMADLEHQVERLEAAAHEAVDAVSKWQHSQTPVLPLPEIAPAMNKLAKALEPPTQGSEQ